MKKRLGRMRSAFRYARCSTLAVTIAALTSAGAVVGVVTAAIEGGAGHALGYFTVQSNLLAAYFCALLVRRNPETRPLPSASLTGAAVLSVSVAGIVFHLHALGDTSFANKAGVASWRALSSQLMHTWVPLGVVATWLLLTPPGRFSFRHTGKWMLAPFAYLGFVVVRAALTVDAPVRYPYAVLDVDRFGYRVVAGHVLLFALVFYATALAVYAIDTWRREFSGRKVGGWAEAPTAAR
ncbi:Pr6Pr family membrane protein [Streptomyces sp. PvR034]|uniref:Pr6Pr family membrane protein n=1 Tax=Streptomyces sp. PvR034 TaxID=3156401 RepID=UPI00339AAC40